MSDDFPSLNGQGTSAGPSGSHYDAAGNSSSNAGPALSAAQALEQAHHGNANDGNTTAGQSSKASGSRKGATPADIDLNSESAFPSLGGASRAAAQTGGWAAKSRANAHSSSVSSAVASQAALLTESVTLPTSSINIGPPVPSSSYQGRSNNNNEASSLGAVLQMLRAKYPQVKLEASTSTAKGTTTFLFKASRQQDIERVKQELRTKVVRKINDTIQVPASTKAFIIGAKGRILKQITDETGVNIQIPRDQAATAEVSNEPEYENDQVEDPLITITLFGDASSISQAKQRILAIVNERTSRLSTKITTVSHDIYHLLHGRMQRNELVAAEDAEHVQVNIPPVWRVRSGPSRGASANEAGEENAEAAGADAQKDHAISVSGEREAVNRTVEAINAAAEDLTRTSQSISLSLSKRQHRFVSFAVIDQILLDTSCSVEVPPSREPSEQITIRGPSQHLVNALQMVMERANSAAVDTVDLATIHGISTPPTYPRAAARYLINKAKLRKIADEEGVQIYIPRQSDTHATIDIVATQGPRGPAAAVADARAKVLDALRSLPPSVFSSVEVDQLLHRFLIGKKGARISALEEKNNVHAVFPQQQGSGTDGDERTITLIYVGSAPSNAYASLAAVKEEILKLAKDAADISTQTLQIPAKLHRYIIGPSGTTLNALIGTSDDRIVNVRFGSSANGKQANGDPSISEDEVVIRGPSDEVKRIAKEIQRVAEEGKNEDIVNGHVAEFDIEQRYVAHIVGKGGAGVQKLREELGVRIDFGDNSAAPVTPVEGTVLKGKKSAKASTSQKSQVKIQGRKENVEEAKRRVLKQMEQLADEVTLNVPVLPGLDRGSLIGKQGIYVQRLESKYEVRVNFPRSNAAEDGERDDIIVIRGPKKGAESAKKELVDLMEYEKEHNQSVTMKIPVKALPRVFGRGGAAIRELQDQTGASIDVNRVKADDPSSPGEAVIKGTKQAIAAAKSAIQAIVSEIQDEVTHEIEIERSLHTGIIGKGGQNIRDLIARCGGPTDQKAAGNVVRFPRAGEDAETVIVRAASSIADKIKKELEKIVAEHRDRVVIGLVSPANTHARIIGRGGSGINELQSKHNIKVIMPGRNEYNQVGPVSNAHEVGDASESDIIKLVGSSSACEAAASEIKERVATAPAAIRAPREQRQVASSDAITATVNVPARYHARVTQGGKFFRTLPGGVKVDHGDVKPQPARAAINGAGKAARIDEDESDQSGEFSWEITELSQGGDDDIVQWSIRGNDQEKVDRVEKMIQTALERCKQETHQGVLTVPQGLIPRIVGRQGSGLDKLRALGVSVEVEGRSGANTVIFQGNPNDLEKAREAVVELREQQRNGNDRR